MSSAMRLGVVIPQVGPWRQLHAQFAWAEEIGYDAAYVYDHLTHATAPGRWLADSFTTLGALAVRTERIALGTLVASATLHSPVSLARRAGTVQDLSGGRFVLGLGVGAPTCALADRGEQPTPAEMHARWRDVVVGLRAVWAGDTDWEGPTRSFRGLQTLALPAGTAAPPLVLAAHGPRALRFAAEHADGWNTYGGPGSTTLSAEDYWAELGRQVARMDAACAEVGRTRPLARSLLLGFGAVQPTASVASYTEAIGRAGELGFDELVVYGPGAAVAGGRAPSDARVHEAVVAGGGPR